MVDNSNSSTSSYSMYLFYCDNDIEETKNKINMHAPFTNYGLRLYYCDGTSLKPGLIANYFISQISASTSTNYGVYCYKHNIRSLAIILFI